MTDNEGRSAEEIPVCGTGDAVRAGAPDQDSRVGDGAGRRTGRRESRVGDGAGRRTGRRESRVGDGAGRRTGRRASRLFVGLAVVVASVLGAASPASAATVWTDAWSQCSPGFIIAHHPTVSATGYFAWKVTIHNYDLYGRWLGSSAGPWTTGYQTAASLRYGGVPFTVPKNTQTVAVHEVYDYANGQTTAQWVRACRT